MITARYSVQDFKNARYNVLDIGTKKITEAFPDLDRFPEFKKDYEGITSLDSERVIRYTMLLYMDNILHKSIPDLAKRKKEAARLAGFEVDLGTKRFPEALEKIMKCEDLDVNQLIVRVIRLNNNNAFEQLVIYEEARARQMYKLLSPQTGDEKTKEVHENIRRMSQDMVILEKELTYDEKSKDLINALYYEVENVQLGIRPEEIAEGKRANALDSILLNVYQEEEVAQPDFKKMTKRKRGRPKKSE